MKKSCSEKESKSVKKVNTTTDVQNRSDSKRSNTPNEHINTGKKLKKNNLTKEPINYSGKKQNKQNFDCLTPLSNEKVQRNSFSTSNLTFDKTKKCVENNFNNTEKLDHLPEGKISKEKSRLSKFSSEANFIPFSKKTSLISQVSVFLNDNKEENIDLNQCLTRTNVTLKSSKKISSFSEKSEFINETSKEIILDSGNSEGVFPGLLGKKRGFHLQKHLDSSKKLKMEETNNNIANNIEETNSDTSEKDIKNIADNNNSNNKEMPLPEKNMLKIDLKLEKSKSSVKFNMRDIKTIVAECEYRNRKWKETYAKYRCPARWGIPIVKNCSEKWDGKQIPQGLLNRYQKFLMSKNLSHPVFLPVTSDINFDLNNSSDDISAQSSNNVKEDCRNLIEEKNSKTNFNEESCSQGEESLKSNIISNGARMVLRNRNQYKPIVIEDDDCSSDGSNEWITREKSDKVNKNSSKGKKCSMTNKQLLLKLERCNINNKNCDTEEKLGEKSNSSNQDQTSSKVISEADTVACPICNFRFPKQIIESHATECASKTFKD